MHVSYIDAVAISLHDHLQSLWWIFIWILLNFKSLSAPLENKVDTTHADFPICLKALLRTSECPLEGRYVVTRSCCIMLILHFNKICFMASIRVHNTSQCWQREGGKEETLKWSMFTFMYKFLRVREKEKKKTYFSQWSTSIILSYYFTYFCCNCFFQFVFPQRQPAGCLHLEFSIFFFILILLGLMFLSFGVVLCALLLKLDGGWVGGVLCVFMPPDKKDSEIY